jgi:hypothetical protein
LEGNRELLKLDLMTIWISTEEGERKSPCNIKRNKAPSSQAKQEERGESEESKREPSLLDFLLSPLSSS